MGFPKINVIQPNSFLNDYKGQLKNDKKLSRDWEKRLEVLYWFEGWRYYIDLEGYLRSSVDLRALS